LLTRLASDRPIFSATAPAGHRCQALHGVRAVRGCLRRTSPAEPRGPGLVEVGRAGRCPRLHRLCPLRSGLPVRCHPHGQAHDGHRSPGM